MGVIDMISVVSMISVLVFYDVPVGFLKGYVYQ